MSVGKVIETLLSSEFLAPEDIVALLQVQEISDDSNIRHRYCSIHGIKLDITYEDIAEHYSSRTNTTTTTDNDDDDDDTPTTTTTTTTTTAAAATATGTTADQDMEFLMWTLHQQHFILAAPYTGKNEDVDNEDDEDDDDDDIELPPSLHPDCINCRKAKFEGKRMCPSCHTFEDYRDIYTCHGLCKKTACFDCHDGVQSCSMPDCDNKKSNYCSDCFQGYYCDTCSSSYHTRCRPSSSCEGCHDHICNTCVDNGES